MAMQEPSPAPSAQVVGNAFVEQYYHILHQSPELVHRFYQDSSSVSRPDANGVMTTVSTMQTINDKILALNYEDYTAEIKTADAQDSFEKGFIVLVTGSLTGKDNVRKKFAQTFFLAPQDKGYFVLNDVFRYVEDDTSQITSVPVNAISENARTSAQASEPELSHADDHHVVETAVSIEEEDLNNGAEVYDPSDKEEGSVVEEETAEHPAHPTEVEILTGADLAPAIQEDAPKKSYASIVKVMKGTAVSSPVYVPTSKVKTAPLSTNQSSVGSAKPAPALEASVGSAESAESSNINEEGHSIYVRDLPFNATPAQLEDVFKRFGPIKANGIQVRSNKGFCFGFVEFEKLSSMQSALEASPIIVGNHHAIVEEKRTNNRVGSGGARGRFTSGRSTFRSDSFKGRGNYGSGRGYGRGDYRIQGDLVRGEVARLRGSGRRHVENYQQVNHNGRGRSGGATRSPA